MFIQIDSKTHIRSEHVSAVSFGTSYANVFVAGAQVPFRVSSHIAIEFLRNLVGQAVETPVVTDAVDTVATNPPETQEKAAKPRSKK